MTEWHARPCSVHAILSSMQRELKSCLSMREHVPARAEIIELIVAPLMELRIEDAEWRWIESTDRLLKM